MLDKNGEPITGLTAADFRAEFRGKPVKILQVKMRSRPTRVVVVLDHSGSMRDTFKGALEVVRHVFSKAPSDVYLALLLFSDRVTTTLGFMYDRATALHMLRAAVDQANAVRGRTALYDALIAAVELHPRPSPGDAIYLVSDAGKSVSRATFRVAEERLLASGLRLFAFLIVDPFISRGVPEELEAKSQLYRLADGTGGAVLASNTKSTRLEEEADRVYRQMADFYEIEIELPKRPDKKRGWKLALVRAKELKRPQVAYPRFLMPCAASPTSKP